MSSARQPVRSSGMCGASCAHLKAGKSPSEWSGAVCVPSGRCRLWNQGPSSAMAFLRHGSLLRQIAFQFGGAVRGRVRGQDAGAGALADGAGAPSSGVSRRTRRVSSGVSATRISGRGRRTCPGRPRVADDGDAAGGGLEQPDAGRVARRDHVGPRDVERQALGVVEGAVLGGRQVLDALDVGGPGDVVRVLRPGDDETAFRPARAGSSSSRVSGGWRSALYVPR